MPDGRPPGFGEVLQRYRIDAGLTQEELAERAGLSRRGLSDLERGARRTPRAETARRLLAALGLADADRAAFLAASRRTLSPPASGADEPNAAHPGLPVALTSFVGREQEIAAIERLLGGTRLLTLTGAGGVGKTRLALEIAARLVATDPGAVWLVELAPLADPDAVTAAVAAALRVPDAPGRPLLEAVAHYLRPREGLLVLDNCEHLIEACARLAGTLLGACPRLRVLATSRERLEIAGETVWRVPSLTVPDARPLHSATPAEDLLAYEGVRLFVERARAALPAFALDESNARAVADVCRRLDGIPLALELAAGRVGGLTVEQIATRLDDRFRLLTRGDRGALARHRTLRALVEWSHDLLDAGERSLFRRLSAFAGGWTVEAAEEVCGLTAGDAGSSMEVLGLLLRLVDKSLVSVESADRYRLLETLRAYGRERLAAAGEADAIRARHAAYYTSLAEEADARLRGHEQRAWQERLEAELDNLRAALQWSLDRGEGEQGLRLGGALGWFWYQRSYLGEGRAWMERLLALPVPAAAGSRYGAIRARALFSAGVMALQQGDFAQARAWHEEGLAVARAADDPWGVGWSFQGLGHTHQRTGQYAAARAHLAESLARWRALGHRWGEAFSLNWVGNVAYAEGRLAEARDLYGQALSIRRELGDAHSSANTLEQLGRVSLGLGEDAAARPLFEESLALHREIGHRQGVARALVGLGLVAGAAGDHDAAQRLLGQAVTLFDEISDRVGTAEALEGAAVLAHHRGAFERAARLSGAADALRARISSSIDLPHGRQRDATLAAVRAALGAAVTAAAWAEGRAMPAERAVAEALRAPPEARAHRLVGAGPARDGLTRREREVVELVAGGLSNREIADRLVISERTAETHVSSVLAKLGLPSRARIAVWVREQRTSTPLA